MLKSGDLGPTGLVVGQSGREAQNRENPTRSGDITCMPTGSKDIQFSSQVCVLYVFEVGGVRVFSYKNEFQSNT